MANAKTLSGGWVEEMVPILNGVTYPDGRWQSIELVSEGDVGSRTKRARVISLMPIDFSSKEVLWTYFTQLAEATDESGSVKVVAGEGGQGADGVIAAVAAANNELIWILFFDTSNPFDKVEVRDHLILARSTSGRNWTVSLADPSQILIH